ncbi:unnamed protein product [Rhizopus microsporus]|nr:hypothetical protein G6F71_000641 [Rhizopus microsporus]KAG1214717.1 hypothetical protein G6F69_001675 [Rhizopus microsporus]KAG1235837.1 hypothetical protein G6F67_002447 [Rhizopus microsporus]KAG1266634.1 hypothetical protein G6F68_002593 [Rhizopus microsporus]
MTGGGNIKVVVRCRPLNSREIARGATCLIRMEGNQTIITKPPDHKGSRDTEDVKAFTFDKSYWSFDKNDPKFADQNTVYNDLGVELLNHAFDGYNCCIFAYGQTGAGKSYSMMGYGEDKGIIPRTCSELFERIANNTDSNLTYRVEVSYIEIYNEKVRDLLNPKNKGNLKVREHPSTGPYVEDLSRLAVKSFDDINHLMDEGNKARTVAATNMNETSSRSHAVFTLFLTQIRFDEMTKLETEKVARISLVDLAGSERANSTGATGARLKEGANINRSLTTLGKVISGLADQSMAKGKKGKEIFIPYRDSVLTWLLKDSLGGNSKTAMIAAISPADYDETLSTLRYADQAKKIQNKAVVNEDPNAKMIRELKEELSQLRERLRVYAPEVVEELNSSSAYKQNEGLKSPMPTPSISNAHQVLEIVDSKGQKKKMSKQEIVEQLQSSEKLLANLNETWEEKLKKTQQIHHEREKALMDLGITIDKNDMGIYTPKTVPFIVNLNEDPLMSECLMYQIKPGKTRVGRQDGESQCEIRLSGANIQDEHCWFEYVDNIVTLHPSSQKDTLTMVNGIRINEPRRLKNGYRIILGHHHIFRFNHPEEVRRERNDLLRASTPSTERTMSPNQDDDETVEVVDWNYARLEAMRNHYSTEANFDGLNDDEIEKLYDDIGKIRQARRIRDGRSEFDVDEDDSASKRLSTAATMVDDGSVCTDATLVTYSTIQERIKDVQEKHQKELDQQRSFYEAKLNRMSTLQYIPEPYSQRELELSKKVIQQWKRLRYVAMAEVVLTHAVLLKEANIISRELEKDVLYQFAIIEEGFTHLQSHWEETSSLQQFETDQDEALIKTPKPCVGIRVIDRKNQVIYFWSLEKLKERLEKMRKLRNFIDRPQYRKHFNWEDPFYESPCPKYSFIGSASVSVRNLVEQQAYESCVEVLCRMTGQVKGKLRLLVSPIARSGTEDQKQVLEVGQQLLFEIRLLELIGLSESEFTQVHVQFRLSSFGGISVQASAEKLFATQPASGFNNTIVLDYSQTMSILITERVQEVLMNKMISFEMYGVAQPRALSQYERWDDQREKPRLDEMLADHRPTPERLSMTMERRPEEELISAERHDILAWIQVCELMPNGEYTPVQVMTQTALDRGVFQLRQGLQRRICITLSHTSGRQFVWNRISKAMIGQVRLLDAKGRIIPSPAHEDIVIRLMKSKSEVEYKNDGTSVLKAQGSWDSSQHDCLFLNRLTAHNTRVLLTLKWEVEAEKCLKPIQCSMDIAVRIQSRDASNSGHFRLFKLLGSSTRYLTKCSGVFLVHLRPPMTRRVSQLWRLNTACKFVPGEEFLGSWRPRGVSLIHDFKRIRERIDRKEQVSRTAQTLMLHTARSQTSHGSMNTTKSEPSESQSELIRKILLLWNQKWGTDKEIILSQDPPIPGMQEIEKEVWSSSSKLISEVKLVTEIDNVTKKGYLTYQENALNDKWIKRWFVLRRPYIYIYTNQLETEEVGIINVSTVRIDYNRALEQMIERNNVFSVYTNNNAYILQANNKADMIDWMKSIDKLFTMPSLS